MGRSIKQQINYAINRCSGCSDDGPGINKHDYKIENGVEMTYRIFSQSEKYNIMDVSGNICRYVNENYTNINEVKQITPDMIQNYLNSKVNTTQHSISFYYSSIKKLEKICTKCFSSFDGKWTNDLIVPLSKSNRINTRGVHNQIPQGEYNKILTYANEHNGIQSNYVISIQNHLGIRTNELTHGLKKSLIDFENNKITIKNTKGGKILIKNITIELKEILKEVIKNDFSNGGDRLFTISNNAVDKQMERICDKLEISRYNIHNIRSRLSQNYYDNCLKNKMSKKDALAATSIFLNHITPREQMLTKSYLLI